MEMVGIGIGYVHSCPDVYSTYSGKSVRHNAQLFSTYQYSGCSLVMVVAHAISHHGYAVVGAHVRRMDDYVLSFISHLPGAVTVFPPITTLTVFCLYIIIICIMETVKSQIKKFDVQCGNML